MGEGCTRRAVKAFTLFVNPLRSVCRCFLKNTFAKYGPLSSVLPLGGGRTIPKILVRNSEPRLSDSFAVAQLRPPGFTLAETLITLVIIGIVAALTVPSLISKHRNDVLVKQFQKVQTTLTNSIYLSQIENGPLTSWDYSSGLSQHDFAKKYLYPYLQITKDCGQNAGEGCFAKGVMYKHLNGDDLHILDNLNYWNKFILYDGASIETNYVNNCIANKQRCLDIYVDVNGPNKGPNIYGRDTFSFLAFPFTNELKPHGFYSNAANSYNPETKQWRKLGSYNCNKSSTSWHCAAYLVANGYKMDY